MFDVVRNRASYWRRVDERSGEEYEVVCLRDPTFRDYAERTSEMLSTVGAIEQRPIAEVYDSIASVSFDVTEMHIARADAPEGFISLRSGAHAFQGALKMYAAAAAAELERKAHFGNLSTGQVGKFVTDNVRLGQTKLGSYVITAVTKLPSAIRQSKLPLDDIAEDPDPFERRVTLRLATALCVARDAAIQNSHAAFQNGIQHGVSADLCDAVAKMAEGDGFIELNISLRWSWLRPRPPLSIAFNPQIVRNLREGGSHLRFRGPMTNFRLVGQVVWLERFPHEESGTVGILGFVGLGEPIDVAVSLGASDYSSAMAAHQTGETVVCIGELKLSSRGYALLGAHHFAVPGHTSDWPSQSQSIEPNAPRSIPESISLPSLPEGKKPKK